MFPAETLRTALFSDLKLKPLSAKENRPLITRSRKDGTGVTFVAYPRRLRSRHATSTTHSRRLRYAIRLSVPGAFPVGMMTEIVRARIALTPYFNDVTERTPDHFKRDAIQNSLYGVDVDAGAVENQTDFGFPSCGR